MLAAKASLAIRVDALSETSDSTLGVEARAKLESRVRNMDENAVSEIVILRLYCLGCFSIYPLMFATRGIHSYLPNFKEAILWHNVCAFFYNLN